MAEDSPDKPIPDSVTTWAVHPGGDDQVTLNYGDIHEIMHRDVSIGNDYRKERIKHLTTLATGVFAITVTFHKDMLGGAPGGCSLASLISGWGFLIVSLFAGMIHLRKWEDFYLSHRASANALWKHHVAETDANREAAARKWHCANRQTDRHQEGYQFWNWFQTGTLLVGFALLAASVGLSALDTPKGTAATETQTEAAPGPDG